MTVDEWRRPGCVLLPDRFAVSGWEVGYRLGLSRPDGLRTVKWTGKNRPAGEMGERGEKAQESFEVEKSFCIFKAFINCKLFRIQIKFEI
jgi:hypothetical protein